MRMTLTFLLKKNINTLYARAQTELINIFKWLSANKLASNINKTKYIMFASSKKIILANDSLKLCFYRKPIERVENVLFLSIISYYTKLYHGNLTFLHCYIKLAAI